ncbi:MAG: c-type cytochrome [Alphaproteobacteria bacterium]
MTGENTPKIESIQDTTQDKVKIESVLDPTLKRGKRMFLRCKSCHTVEAGGSNGTGPNLHGIFGARAGQKDGFNYSKAMILSELTWDDVTMDAWLERPNKLVPKTSMAFIGIKKAEDREALVKYLKMVSE